MTSSPVPGAPAQRRPASPVATRDALGLLTIYLVLVLLVPARLAVGPLGASQAPATLFGLALLCWWAVQRVVPSFHSSWAYQPARVAVGVLLASILASYAWSALHPLPGDQRDAADRALISVLAMLGPALVAADGLRTRASLDALVRRLVALTSAVAALAIVQFATGFNLADQVSFPGLRVNGTLSLIMDRSDFRRVSSTTTHPIELGMLLVVVFPLALHVRRVTPRYRPYWTFAAGIILLVIPMTLSRSAVIGLAVAFGVLLWGWDSRQRLHALLLAPVFLVIVRLSIPGLVGTIGSLFTNAGNDPSVLNRSDAYALVGPYISASPVFGRGFGTFVPADFFFLDNQYLGSLVETGFLGVAAILAFFVVAFGTARQARRRCRDRGGQDLAQAFAAGIAAAGVSFALFDGLGFAVISGVLFLVVGCAGALWRLGGAGAPGAPAVARAGVPAPGRETDGVRS